jgi:hypothetical protein
MTSIKCDYCGQNYEVYNVDVLGHREDLWFLRALCSSCHTQCLVAAVIKEDKRSEVVTDLVKAEPDKFNDADVVGKDDVLNMHSFLKNFDGDFSQLFRQGQP